jgi:glutamate-1-semialdehyde 2,1-aminomutase
MNLIAPEAGFLSSLRALCTQYGSVLIFDEVMTGFRVGLECAQGLYQIKPDLTTLGKVIGGGMPMAAFGGKREIMQCLAPVGAVYQAGTLSGNPVAVAAGLATLRLIQEKGFYDNLATRTRQLTEGLTASARRHGIDFCAQSIGGMFGLYFSKDIPGSFAEVMSCDKNAFNRFFHAMLDRGVYFAPSAFEAGFVSTMHGDSEIGETLSAADSIFADW